MPTPDPLFTAADLRWVMVIGFLICAIAWWLNDRLGRYERFFDEHPGAAGQFRVWDAAHPRGPISCPQHKIALLGPRRSCPICGWKPE
jgi:hypothetical protein